METFGKASSFSYVCKDLSSLTYTSSRVSEEILTKSQAVLRYLSLHSNIRFSYKLRKIFISSVPTKIWAIPSTFNLQLNTLTLRQSTVSFLNFFIQFIHLFYFFNVYIFIMLLLKILRNLFENPNQWLGCNTQTGLFELSEI